MFFQPKHLILKDHVQLYNNIAQIDQRTGRLSAEFQFYPVPSLPWEFETYDNGSKASSSRFNKAELQISANGFSIPNASVTRFGSGAASIRGGTARRAYYGDIGNDVHDLTFYLPNMRCQEVNVIGQEWLNIELIEGIERKDRGMATHGRVINAHLEDGWELKLEARNDALEWVKSEHGMIGTRLTTLGSIFRNDRTRYIEAGLSLPSLTYEQVHTVLCSLSTLLSFANGGYVPPLYIQAMQRNGEIPGIAWSEMRNDYVTPLEQLGTTWLTLHSDLSSYVSCESTMRRMLTGSLWPEVLPLVLDWYFQAVQPHKAWQVRANAIGAALELLSFTILVSEETDINQRDKVNLLFDIRSNNKAKKEWNLGSGQSQEKVSSTAKRLQLLLERVGLPDWGEAARFLKVRNEATHPISGNISHSEKERLLAKAFQWVDEIVLWRIGYNGKYLNRDPKRRSSISIFPRYDLSLRHSYW